MENFTGQLPIVYVFVCWLEKNLHIFRLHLSWTYRDPLIFQTLSPNSKGMSHHAHLYSKLFVIQKTHFAFVHCHWQQWIPFNNAN